MYTKFSYKGYNFEGISEGGIRTSIIMPSLSILFDIGNLPVDHAHHENLLLTHGHLDHSAGIPYYISQRSLRKLKPPNIYVPQELYEDLQSILKIYQKIEGFDYLYNLVPVKINEFIQINSTMYFKALKTFHRIVSQGYTIYEKNKKLKEEYKDYSKDQILTLKKQGIDLQEEKYIPIVSFSGDTKIEYVLENKDVANSKILFIECTYLDDKKNVEKAREWGHIHLDEIVQNADSFKNEKIVLIHFSKRYSPKTIKELVYSKIPSSLKDRVECFI
jgi:ribonuclease Z